MKNNNKEKKLSFPSHQAISPLVWLRSQPLGSTMWLAEGLQWLHGMLPCEPP